MKEMRKIGLLLLTGLLLLGMVLTAGCVDEEGNTTSPETETSETEAPETETTEEPSASEESTSDVTLSDLLDLARDSSSATYDMVISGGPLETTTTKVWSTETKQKMESTMMGQTTITIIDQEKQEMYSYFPDQNMAMKLDFSDSETSQQAESFTEIMEDYSPTIVGTETIDGKLCTIIEYESSINDAQTTQKVWVWQRYGFPIRVEATTTIAGTPTTTVMEMKNIEFGPIPDSTFELPAGVDIQEMSYGPLM
ncbi:MAG: DUF4412 domain-containing protein [Halobacteriota archaeon]|nr:DUF4412 domain-containing protein [Halobacteriota archaeon]